MSHLLHIVRCCLPGSLRFALSTLGLEGPSNIAGMAMREPAEYVAAAVMAVNTRGE
jgi:hypothetical protein